MVKNLNTSSNGTIRFVEHINKPAQPRPVDPNEARGLPEFRSRGIRRSTNPLDLERAFTRLKQLLRRDQDTGPPQALLRRGYYLNILV